MKKKYTVKILTDDNDVDNFFELKEWDKFVLSSPQGCIFCMSWWLRLVCPKGFKIIIVKNNQGIVGGMPLQNEKDDLYPYGVPYYLTPYTDTSGTINSSSGFVGKAIKFQDATYSYICANINANNEAKWQSYAAVYTSINNAFLKTFRLGFMYTRFKAPLIVDDPQDKRSAQKRIYTDFDTTAELMNLADQKDDRHTGKDVLSNLRMDEGGLVFVNRLPVIPIPQLNGAPLTPIYCIDFAKFIPYVQDGYWMEEGEPLTDRGQHTTFTVFLDGAHNNLCLNRRTCGFLLHKVS